MTSSNSAIFISSIGCHEITMLFSKLSFLRPLKYFFFLSEEKTRFKFHFRNKIVTKIPADSRIQLVESQIRSTNGHFYNDQISLVRRTGHFDAGCTIFDHFSQRFWWPFLISVYLYIGHFVKKTRSFRITTFSWPATSNTCLVKK